VRLSVAERQIQELIERNHARTALEESACAMADILENTTDGFFAVDSEWKFTFVNSQAEKLLGRTRVALICQDLWKQFPELIGLAQLEAPGEGHSLLSYLSKAGQAAQHAARLSGQLLTFSKGGAPLKRVTSISELLQRATEFSLYGSNLRAELEIPHELRKADVDSGQIEQVINALVINAREAMPHGGVIRISAQNVEVG